MAKVSVKEAVLVKYEWLQDTLDNEFTIEEYKDFVKMLIEFGQGNYDYVPNERVNRIGMKNIRDCIQYNNEHYKEVCQRRRESGSNGGKARAANQMLEKAKQMLEQSKQMVAETKQMVEYPKQMLVNSNQMPKNFKQNQADTDTLTDTGTDTQTKLSKDNNTIPNPSSDVDDRISSSIGCYEGLFLNRSLSVDIIQSETGYPYNQSNSLLELITGYRKLCGDSRTSMSNLGSAIDKKIADGMSRSIVLEEFRSKYFDMKNDNAKDNNQKVAIIVSSINKLK